MRIPVLPKRPGPRAAPAPAVPVVVFLLVAGACLAGCTGEGTPAGAHGNPQVLAYVQKAWALNAKAEFAEADRVAGEALALDPADPDALAMRGWARAGLGRYQEALDALESSLAKNPENAVTWSNKGFSLYNLGRCDEAVAALDQALGRDPYDLGARKLRDLAQGKCPSPPATGAVTTSPAAQAAPKVTDNFNSGGVSSGAECEPVFTFGTSVKVLTITNYHYHGGKGDDPGTISLKDTATGTVFGPYTATGADGQGGVKNAFWNAEPATVIPAGTYRVLDSDPATWSQNAQSGKCGMSMISYAEVSA